MEWRYQNQTDHAIIHKGVLWRPPVPETPATEYCPRIPGKAGTLLCTKYPIPDEVGLTRIQEGSVPDPVIFSDDVVVEGAGGERIVHIPNPNGDEFIDVTIWCGIGDGAFLRFNGPDNTEISIDQRGVIRRMRWEDCATLYLKNPTSGEVVIGISVLKAEVGSLPKMIIPGNSGSGGSSGSPTDHTHSNMADLNKITVPGAGRIATSGTEIIGVKGIEIPYIIPLTPGDVAAKYIELPDDYLTGYPVEVVWEYLPQKQGLDYELIEYTAPTKDRISWAGKSMDGLVKSGDRLSITYYRKI
jgi:hypothetical protein